MSLWSPKSRSWPPDRTGAESLHSGSLWTWGRFLIILSPMWVCDCRTQLQSLQATCGGSAGRSSPAHHQQVGGPWAKSKEAAAKAARGADKTGAWISRSPCETWQLSVLEPGQNLELIAMALPTLTLVFTEAQTDCNMMDVHIPWFYR